MATKGSNQHSTITAEQRTCKHKNFHEGNSTDENGITWEIWKCEKCDLTIAMRSFAPLQKPTDFIGKKPK